jgi:DNA-binding transcriptional LysR family regulator
MFMLNLRQIEAFRATIIAGSVTGASHMLHVSQPSISRLLGDLEKALGFKLFMRHKGGVLPTEEGKLFYEEVERTFSGLTTLEKSAQEIRSLSLGRVKIATVPALAFDIIPSVIKRFHGNKGRLGITLSVRSSRQILDWVAAQKVDLGLVIGPDEYPGVEYIHRVHLNCVCVAPEHHPFATKRSVSLEDLESEQVVLPDKDFLALTDLSRAQVRDITRHSTIESQVFFSSCALVSKDLGVTISDPFTADFFKDRGVVVRPISDSLSYTVSIIRPETTAPSLAVQHLVEELVQVFDEYSSSKAKSEPL